MCIKKIIDKNWSECWSTEELELLSQPLLGEIFGVTDFKHLHRTERHQSILKVLPKNIEYKLII